MTHLCYGTASSLFFLPVTDTAVRGQWLRGAKLYGAQGHQLMEIQQQTGVRVLWGDLD